MRNYGQEISKEQALELARQERESLNAHRKDLKLELSDQEKETFKSLYRNDKAAFYRAAYDKAEQVVKICPVMVFDDSTQYVKGRLESDWVAKLRNFCKLNPDLIDMQVQSCIIGLR